MNSYLAQVSRSSLRLSPLEQFTILCRCPTPAPRSGQARPELAGPVARRPDQGPAVAPYAGRPCPILRKLRPARSPRAAAVCMASCALLSVAGTPRRGARPEHPRHAQRVPAAQPGGPVEAIPASQQLAPGKACHGCDDPRKAAPPRHPRHAKRVTAARPVGWQRRSALRVLKPFFSGPNRGREPEKNFFFCSTEEDALADPNHIQLSPHSARFEIHLTGAGVVAHVYNAADTRHFGYLYRPLCGGGDGWETDRMKFEPAPGLLRAATAAVTRAQDAGRADHD